MTDTPTKPRTKRAAKKAAPEETSETEAPVQVAPTVAGETSEAASDSPPVGEVVNLETTGNFQIYDFLTGTMIKHKGVTEDVKLTPLIKAKIDEGLIKLA